MTTPEEGIEYTDVRKKWPNEALDFTPWLARNLDLLSGAIGLKLELVQEEAAVGPFSCDILAKEVDSGLSAAIENQLEWTDHSHFGQLLTYAAGHNAGIGIWVSPYFRYEHAATLNWLNEWTRDGLSFYGVKVELVKSGDSEPEPRLRKVGVSGCLEQGRHPADRGVHAPAQPAVLHLLPAADRRVSLEGLFRPGNPVLWPRWAVLPVRTQRRHRVRGIL